MHPPNPEFTLPKLRRQLEEILAMVTADHTGATFVHSADKQPMVSVLEYDASVAEPEIAVAEACPESDTICEPAALEDGHPDKRDDLYDDALVVLTEFGQASQAVLQMWLSIDYSRATAILNRFQAEGLISSKGKVSHKAFSLRRTLEQQV